MVHFIKFHVLWKFSFSVWSILGFLFCFKPAKSHLSPKLQVRYLFLAKSAILFLQSLQYILHAATTVTLRKFTNRVQHHFFPRIVGRYDSSKRSIRITAPILLLYELMRCSCVTSLAPSFLLHLTFVHRFMIFPVICNIYDRIVGLFCNAYLSITAVIVCTSFFLPKLFALNKLFVRPFCSLLLYGSCGSHAFFS